jgi:hypothetical protein
MADAEDTARRKVAAVFAELVGERVARLDAARPGHECEAAVAEALASEHGPERAAEIAFHLADWG